MSDGAGISAEQLVAIRGHLATTRCAIERFACELRCDRVRAATIESQRIERNLCSFDWLQARGECLTEPNLTARAECQRTADEAYTACIAELDARVQAAYEACRRRCDERERACVPRALKEELEEQWDWDRQWADEDPLPGPPTRTPPAPPPKPEK